MTNKSKGANAERELLHKLIEEGYMAIRIAGSGILPEPSCDIITGKFRKKFCIEVKASKKPVKYIDKKQIENFLIFSQIFGLKPILAIRFNREGWYFIDVKHLNIKDKSVAISLDDAKKAGKRFAQMFG